MANEEDDLRHIRRLISYAAPTLRIQTKGGVYPYDVGKQLAAPRSFSASTNSMVAHSLACIGGLLAHNSQLVGLPLLPDRGRIVSSALRDCTANAINRTIKEINSPGDDATGVVNSSAFGADDPFTIGWLLELLEGTQHWIPSGSSTAYSEALKRVRSAAKRRVNECLQDPDVPVLKTLSHKGSERFILHPLPLLRIVQIARLLEEAENESYEEDLQEAFEWFLAHLHVQLSRRNIQHSGFDITELVFCLEGMLVSQSSRVTKSILDSVIMALNESRQLNSSLRATTPFRVTSVGMVHLFTSVEVVASLLRSAVLLERHDQAGFFSDLKPTLRHYLSWLQATMVRGTTSLPASNDEAVDPYPDSTPLKYAGWQSEHAHTEDNRVHVWITSQILLFLRTYETLLTADIADAAMQATGVRLEEPRQFSKLNADNVIDEAKGDDPLQLDDTSHYRVVSRLNKLFVVPRLQVGNEDPPFSCLLYGPPGTGKTTLARQVANNLGWPLLTITTSDFILDGEAQVEARAKRLFSMLEMQTGIVIFFDEIDRLVLDRDTSSYSQQGDMLQFMTPSMLTKLNDLRRAERCIFIIGTNYADRIDRAIKRAGRIDHKFLVLPPDLTRRSQFLAGQLDKLGAQVEQEDLQRAAQAGVGRTLAELYSAIRDYARHGGSLVENVKAVSPALSFATYRNRLNEFHKTDLDALVDARRELLEEACLVAYLLTEGQDAPAGAEYAWLRERWTALRENDLVRDDHVVSRLDTLFEHPAS